MNASDLTKKIKWLGREVLAQKQAFLRGQDRTEWSTKTTHAVSPSPGVQSGTYTITVQFGVGTAYMPVCQLYLSIGDWRFRITSFNWNASTRTATYSGYYNEFWEAELDVKAISTEYIENLSVSIIPIY